MADSSIEIRHRNGSYLVTFERFAYVAASLPDDCIVITDSNVHAHWRIEGRQTVVIPPGESAKSLEQFGRLVSECARLGAKRKTTLAALGGGVIGDLAGFVASAYMRGVPYVQVPTSLLAQVDSSVGGKVAIDIPEGKNLVGAFYPPAAVFICEETLGTLPDRHFVNGCAEVIKYGAILDEGLARELDTQPLFRSDPRLGNIVERCIRLKAKVVAEDELDLTGLRACLNFGHTVGHAIERVTGYGPTLHGEAVAVGMVVESLLGEAIGVTPQGTADWMAQYVGKHGLPAVHDCLADAAGLVAAMRTDKKNEGRGLGFSLLTRIGECKLVTGVGEGTVAAMIEKACKRFAGHWLS